MSPTQKTQVSNFVTFAVFEAMHACIGANMALIQQPRLYTGNTQQGEHSPGFVLGSVLGTLPWICFDAVVEDEEDLNYLLANFRKQFSITDECNTRDGKLALEILERAFTAASTIGRDALREAFAGFPASEGCFVRWRSERIEAETDGMTVA